MSKNESRSQKVLIKEAELLSGTNDFIYNYFFYKSEENERIEVDDLDKQTEANLLGKNDDFIDVTLAQYCRFEETISNLFSKSIASRNFSLRLACLTNRTLGRTNWMLMGLPNALFNDSKVELQTWLLSATDLELDALFRNQTIDTDFLTNFLCGEGNLWNLLSEDKQLIVIRALCNNKIFSKQYEGPMDGYAEYTHDRLFTVTWDLVKTVPVTRRWGWALGFLLDAIIDVRYKFDSLNAAKRWYVVDEEEEIGSEKYSLNPFETVRCAIYKDVIKDLHGKDKSNKTHFDNEDLAYRACAYEQLTLITVDDMKEAYAKDRLIAIEQLMKNLNVWRQVDLRTALKDICWDADSTINNNHLDCANSFKRKEKELTKRYPNWFAEDDDNFADKDESILTLGVVKGLLLKANYQQSGELLAELLAVKESLNAQNSTLKLVSFAVISLVVLACFKY